MDPDAKVQVATLGTALYYSAAGAGTFVGTNGAYDPSALQTALAGYTRVYGLASTPDFGGQPAAEVTYEINMMTFADVPSGVTHNLRGVKSMADDKVKAHWIVVKASGVIIEYDAVTNISYTADAQQDIEKFSIYHDVKSDIAVSLPSQASQ